MLGTNTGDADRLITDILLPGCGARAYGEMIGVGSAENDIVVKVLASTNLNKVTPGDAADIMTLKIGQAVRYTCCVQSLEGDTLHLRWDTPGREIKRRLDARFASRLNAKYVPVGESTWIECTVEDVSAGGLRLALPSHAKCEGLIDVKVHFDDENLYARKRAVAQDLVVRCRVMRNWVTPSGIACAGVAFTTLDKRAESTLEKLLDRLASS